MLTVNKRYFKSCAASYSLAIIYSHTCFVPFIYHSSGLAGGVTHRSVGVKNWPWRVHCFQTLPLASLTSEQPVPAFTSPNQVTLSPLYVNDYSPVLVQQTEQLFQVGVGEQTRQPIPAFSSGTEGGLRRRNADTDALSKKTMVRPVRMRRELVERSSEDDSGCGVSPGSLVAIEKPVSVIQEKVPEMVAASGRPMGLLSRYALERRGNE